MPLTVLSLVRANVIAVARLLPGRHVSLCLHGICLGRSPPGLVHSLLGGRSLIEVHAPAIGNQSLASHTISLIRGQPQHWRNDDVGIEQVRTHSLGYPRW